MCSKNRQGPSESLTIAAESVKHNAIMGNWNIKASTLFVLGGLVFLMLLIVVLPDVDLPDTAFHRGTAPIVVHAQGTSAPVAGTVAFVFRLPVAAKVSHAWLELEKFRGGTVANFRPILLRSIRC